MKKRIKTKTIKLMALILILLQLTLLTAACNQDKNVDLTESNHTESIDNSSQEDITVETNDLVSNNDSDAGDDEVNDDGLYYWSGMNFGPNLEYAEEYLTYGDAGEYLNAAEAAQLVFYYLRDNDNIPDYSDDIFYKIILIELSEIDGEECYVYRLEIDENNDQDGTMGASYAFAYGSGNIYIEGSGSQFISIGQLPFSTVVVYADFSAGSAEGNGLVEEYVYQQIAEVDVFDISAALSELSGFDFDIYSHSYDGVNMHINWSQNSTLLSGLDNRVQKEGFHFYDTASLNWFIMDSLARSIKANINVEHIFYSQKDGSPLEFADGQGIEMYELPTDQSYEGSLFFISRVGAIGDN